MKKAQGEAAEAQKAEEERKDAERVEAEAEASNKGGKGGSTRRPK